MSPAPKKRRPFPQPGDTVSGGLRAIIRARGLTPYAIATAAGVSPSILTRFVNGERGLTSPTLDAICRDLCGPRPRAAGDPPRAARRDDNPAGGSRARGGGQPVTPGRDAGRVGPGLRPGGDALPGAVRARGMSPAPAGRPVEDSGDDRPGVSGGLLLMRHLIRRCAAPSPTGGRRYVVTSLGLGFPRETSATASSRLGDELNPLADLARL